MTLEEIQKLETRSLDYLVAEKIMGWEHAPECDLENHEKCWSNA